MKQTYLPGTVRERIQDLMKGKKMTQADLAKRIGINRKHVKPFHNVSWSPELSGIALTSHNQKQIFKSIS